MESRASDSRLDVLRYHLEIVNTKLAGDCKETVEVDLRSRREILQQVLQAKRQSDDLIGFEPELSQHTSCSPQVIPYPEHA